MLSLGLNIDASGWIAKSAAARELFQSIPIIELDFTGTHSVLHVANSSIAKHAIANGDQVWAIPATTLREMARKVRAGLLRAIKAKAGNIHSEMIDAMNIAVAGLRTAYYEGKIDGPARTAVWNAYKAANFSPPTPNMIASGEWLRSLKGRLLERQGGAARTGVTRSDSAGTGDTRPVGERGRRAA